MLWERVLLLRHMVKKNKMKKSGEKKTDVQCTVLKMHIISDKQNV